jgi:hypothetical protein
MVVPFSQGVGAHFVHGCVSVLIEHRSERKRVASGVQLFVADLFRRHALCGGCLSSVEFTCWSLWKRGHLRPGEERRAGTYPRHWHEVGRHRNLAEDVTRDGRFLLLSWVIETPSPLTLVQNWDAELKK